MSNGLFRVELSFLNARDRGMRYTCNYAYSAIPRDKENSFEIIKELNGKLSHHHDNGNVLNRTSMGNDLFNTYILDEI
jgi:hypothetical protein